MRVLVVDNYDSFVFNLVQYLGQLGVEVEVLRNDAPALAVPAAAVADYAGVLISPGPGTPERAGASVSLVRACAETATSLLGVCLGHQAIGVAFGATVDRAPELRHGKTSSVEHANAGVLRDLPNPFTATRYHSLTVLPETLPADLEPVGRTAGGVVMAFRHTELPIHGVQFHPESVLTQGGHRILANWLELFGARPPEQLVVDLEQQMAELAPARG
ncbi:aminodeoxychorismate/anthranilate synthase component II [Skermania piniformis]|uniref:Aminodeoxychorismate/anthranilate synthase component II n=1 Tax=Skermania pinensis TaxID=39122 RepID=A0ABX8S8Z7_9ACTN|nr:aminodeoxychorismate/anthranilate synthase component II [Skermania piniformis]QXQ13946.1 aminodeoxychorismate/anthranilate synthase component II [Skermania piniformis]